MTLSEQISYYNLKLSAEDRRSRVFRNLFSNQTPRKLYEDMVRITYDDSFSKKIIELLFKMYDNAILKKHHDSNYDLLVMLRRAYGSKGRSMLHHKQFFMFMIKTLLKNNIINYKTLRNFYDDSSREIKDFIITEFLAPEKLLRHNTIRFLKTRGEMFNDTVKLLELDLVGYARQIKQLKKLYCNTSVERHIEMKKRRPDYRFNYASIRPADVSKHKKFFLKYDTENFLKFMKDKNKLTCGNYADSLAHRLFKRNDFKKIDSFKNTSIYKNICCVLNNINVDTRAYSQYNVIDFMYGYTLKYACMQMSTKRCIYINSNEGELYTYEKNIKDKKSEAFMNELITETKLLEPPLNKPISVSKIVDEMIKKGVKTSDGILIFSTIHQELDFGLINEHTKEFICIERYKSISNKDFTVLFWRPQSNNTVNNEYTIHYYSDSVINLVGYNTDFAKQINVGNIHIFRKNYIEDYMSKCRHFTIGNMNIDQRELMKCIKKKEEYYEGVPF